MGQAVSPIYWARDKVKEYEIRDARSFLAAYNSISLDLYIEYGDPDGYNLDIAAERERNLVRRVEEIARWSAENTDMYGQMFLFASTAPSPSKDPLFLCRVRSETNSRGAFDIARLAEKVEKGDWEWVVGRIWSYRRAARADADRGKKLVMVDELSAGGDAEGDINDADTVDRAERKTHKNNYGLCRVAVIDDRLDAEKLYRRRRNLFDECGIEKDNAIQLIGYAQRLATVKCCNVEDILGDSKFRSFLRGVAIGFSAPALVAA